MKGSRDLENGEALPQGYAKSMQAIAERRMVLAGYRLADSLKQLFAK